MHSKRYKKIKTTASLASEERGSRTLLTQVMLSSFGSSACILDAHVRVFTAPAFSFLPSGLGGGRRRVNGANSSSRGRACEGRGMGRGRAVAQGGGGVDFGKSAYIWENEARKQCSQRAAGTKKHANAATPAVHVQVSLSTLLRSNPT